MKITKTILSIPPHISTTWESVAAITQTDPHTLEIRLITKEVISIPNLSQENIDHIFSSHLEWMEHSLDHLHHQDEFIRQKDLHDVIFLIQAGIKEIMALILKLGSSAISSVGKALEHDPKNSNMPPLSQEMKEKVLMLLNIVPQEDILAMPPPHAECNCMYCQITQILRSEIGYKEENKDEERSINRDNEEHEEEVLEKDLEFSEWNVTAISEKLFLVRNKLDPHEEYRVFLGNPIGCTCGRPNCDHIVAALRS